MSKHTPGPWKVCGDPTSVCFDGGHGSKNVLHPTEARYPTEKEEKELGDDCHDDWFICSCSGHPCDRPYEELEANARLIAAAPELLEVCKLAIPLLKDEWDGTNKNSEGNKVIEQIQQVIAKAEESNGSF